MNDANDLAKTLSTAAAGKTGAGLLALALVLPLSFGEARAQTGADELPEVDISGWRCRFCEFEEGWSAEITVGAGRVSDDSAKFGEYNGLDEEGAFPIAAAEARYRGEDATYLDLSVSDLGLDSRSLSIGGGRQGGYGVYLSYDEIPHRISDSASTPYLGSGGDRLTLPGGWVDGAGTAGMTALDASLREVDLETQRKRLGAGLRIATTSPWSYRVDVRRDDKEGSKRGGGAFFFRSAQLVEPVEYVTDEIEAALTYSQKRWQASLAYYGSTFTNRNESLRFASAYTPIVAGADEGEIALPPDNEFHQLSLAAGYRFGETTHLGAELAAGRMRQDEKLLRSTLNPALAAPALPADSADVRVDTTNARLRFSTRPLERLLVSASYLYDDRDNRTSQLLYDWVSTDMFLAAQRANLPYSTTRSAFKVKADYDYSRGTRLGIGYDRDERERTFQEVDQTDEDTLWATWRMRNVDSLFVEFKLAFSAREASSYEPLAEIDPAQNVLLRKYNLADRDRQLASVYASFAPAPAYSVGLAVETARDDYDDSELGLTDGSENSRNLDVSAMLSEDTSLTVFVGTQRIESSQAGSQAFAGADWFASNDDRYDYYGLGLSQVLIEGVLRAGLDISRARSTSRVELSSGAPFPALRADLDSLRLNLDYRLDDNLSLQGAYWYETYDAEDWSLEGLAPDSVPNLLAFGEEVPSYSNNVVAISLTYRF